MTAQHEQNDSNRDAAERLMRQALDARELSRTIMALLPREKFTQSLGVVMTSSESGSSEWAV